MASQSFTGQLLIAMPNLGDPNFLKTVTLICQHSTEGALGVVINRPLDLKLSELLEHVQIEPTPQARNRLVHYGGPVQTHRGFILHEPLDALEATLAVTEDIGLSTSRDALAAIAEGRGQVRNLIALGYAGWGAGQLEQEIAENAWLTVANDPAIVFELPFEERWAAAAGKLGVDLNLLSDAAGHA